jgi:hypothetical protein
MHKLESDNAMAQHTGDNINPQNNTNIQPNLPSNNTNNANNQHKMSNLDLAFSFKPEPFNGRNNTNAANWWEKFVRYSEIADASHKISCDLLRLLLSEDAEIWFNFLPIATQRNVNSLKTAFEQQYVEPSMDKHVVLANVRARCQGPTESLRAFLTDMGSKLKCIDYPRNVWLDLIFFSLRPEILTAILCFVQDKTLDNVLDQEEKIERHALFFLIIISKILH